MLDHPERTPKLLAALKAAVPFEVELTERLVNQLRAQHHAGADQKHHTVSDVSYRLRLINSWRVGLATNGIACWL